MVHCAPVTRDHAAKESSAPPVAALMVASVPEERFVPPKRDNRALSYERSAFALSILGRALRSSSPLSGTNMSQMLQPMKNDFTPQSMALDIEQAGGVRLVAAG